MEKVKEFRRCDLCKIKPSVNKSALDDGLCAICFLLTLVPEWAKEAPKGLDPTMYGTGTQVGDAMIVDRVKECEAILKKHGI